MWWFVKLLLRSGGRYHLPTHVIGQSLTIGWKNISLPWRLVANTIGLPYPRILHLWIQPVMIFQPKIFEKNSRKFHKPNLNLLCTQPGCSLKGLMLKLKLQYLATSCEELTHWKRPWCWEGLGTGGEGDDRGWDGWMASPTQWTWIWMNSGSWWWTGRPGVLRFMLSKSRTRLSNWTELNYLFSFTLY